MTPLETPLPPKVWIIDDERELADTYAQFLDSNYTMRCFYDAQTALKAFDENPQSAPAVIVADMNMPKMDGIALLDELRAKDVRTPVILVSGFTEKAELAEAVNRGIFSFVEKPCHPQHLRDQIERALERGKLSQTKDDLIALLAAQTVSYSKLIRLLEKRYVHAENRLYAEDVKVFPFLTEVAEFLKKTREETDLYQQIEADNKKLGALLSKY